MSIELKIYTWGYQSRNSSLLVSICDELAIRWVVDVRRYAKSSQPGWSWRELRESFFLQNSTYVALPGLGNFHRELPWKRGDRFLLDACFREVRSLLLVGDVVLLCRERNHRECHRAEVADWLAAEVKAEVRHLGSPVDVDPEQLTLL